MRTTPSYRQVYAAAADRLEAAGLTVGRGVADGLTDPYVVLHQMPSGRQDGNLADPYCTEPFVVQVSAWARDVTGCLWAADEAREALFNGITAPSGWAVMHVAEDVGGGVTRDDATASPPLFQAVNRYRIWITPAEESS